MTQPTDRPGIDQLRNLADRAERGPLTADESARLRDGIDQLYARVQDWRTSTGAGMRLVDELRAERDALAAGVPLVCSDERHKTKVFALETALNAAEERADRHEATLTAVRDELAAIDRDRARLDDDCDAFGGGYADAAARIRAVLDQHGQTPA